MSIKMVFVSQVTDSHATDVEGVGTLRFEANGKVYRYVKNSDTANALTAGQIVGHTVTNGETANTQVTTSATANLRAMAGVIASTTIEANAGTLPKCFGWLQVAGSVSTLFLPAGTITTGSQYIGLDASSSGTDITTANISTSRYDRFLEITTPGSVTAVGATGTAPVARISGCFSF